MRSFEPPKRLVDLPFEQKERDFGGLGVPVVAVGDSGYVWLFNMVRGEFVKRLCEGLETSYIARRRPNPVKSAIRSADGVGVQTEQLWRPLYDALFCAIHAFIQIG